MIFCADGGGTKTDAVLLDVCGREIARSRAGPCNFWRDPDAAAAALADAWRAMDRRPAGVRACIAAAGLSSTNAVARVRIALPGFDTLHVVSDGYAALAGAFGAQPGALIVVGTGVAGIARDAAGRVRRASGWGFPAGDRGGGAWLGFALVQAWLERLDGYDWPDSVLWSQLAHRVGASRADVLTWLRRAAPAEFAEFVPAIVAAMDGVAETLLSEATVQIERLAVALCASPPNRPRRLALSGGLAQTMAPRLSGYDIRLDIDPLLGCARIAGGEVDAADPTLP